MANANSNIFSLSVDAFTINAANVVIGDSSVPGYAFKPRVLGTLGLDQVGAPAHVEIDGNITASGLRLLRDGAERVFISGANGDLTTSTFPGVEVGNASFMSTGVLDPARISGDYTMGTLNVPGTLTTPEIGGNINASTVVTGVLDDARLDGSYAFNSLALSGGATAVNATGNIDAGRVVTGTVHPNRMVGGQYSFQSLSLSGNVNAPSTTVHANADAGWIVHGNISNDRLVGPYTVDDVSASGVVAMTAVLSGQPGGRGLVADGGNVVASTTTAGEMAFLHGVTGTIQTQLDAFRYGLFDGNLVSNLNASQLTQGTVHDDRLTGSFTFDDLALDGELVAGGIDANLDASDLTTGTVHPSRIVGDFVHISALDVAETLDAASIDAGLDAGDLVGGTIDNTFLQGAYVADSLTATTANAAWVSGNIDTHWLSSGTIPQERFDFESLASNVVSAGSYLGTSSAPWHEAAWKTASVDDIEIGSAIRLGGATMQLDLEQTASSIVPENSSVTIGTPAIPWSNVYGTDLLIDRTMIVEGGIVDESGNSLSFNLEQVPVSILPARDGLWFGTHENPWGPVRTGGFVTEVFDGNTASTPLRPSASASLGSASQPWSNLFTANATGALDGNGVGDVWAQVDVTSGTIEALDGIHLPSEVAAFRFLDDETTGFGLRDGTTPGSVDVTVGGTTAVTVESGTVAHTGRVAPSVNGARDLGAPDAAWRDVYASNVHTPSGGRIGDDGTITSGRFEVSGNVDVASVVASGTIEAGILEGSLATSHLTGAVDDARFGTETYTIANLDVGGNARITGSLTCGNLVPSGNAVYDLGSASNRFRDIYLSNGSIALGTATISEVDGYVTFSSNVLVTDRVYGNIGSKPVISNIQITDASWTVVDDTALPPEGGKFLLNGSGLAPGTLCMVGNTFASSTSYVSPNQLRVDVPAKSVGSYDVHVVRGDTKSATLPSGLTYSNVVTWITSSTLGDVEYGQSFTIPLVATSDSSVWYANVTSLPADTTLDPFTGNLSGNITSVTTSTLFAFDVDAVDQELQDARRSFLLQLLVLLVNGATYTDASWNAVTQTALDANSGSVYFTVDGTGMNEVTGVFVGGTPATSFTALDDSTLRVTGPQKPRGTYDVTLQNGAGSKTLSNGVFYSDVPVWTTAANLGTVYRGQSFTFPLVATSDSAIVSYANTAALPSGVSLNGTTGNLTGNITTIIDATYNIGIKTTDSELQASTRTFEIQYIVAQYYYSPLMSVLGYYQASRDGTTLNPSGDNIVTLANNVGTGGDYFGSVLLPNGKVLLVPAYKTTAGLVDPITLSVSNIGSFGGGAAYGGGVLLHDGRVMMIPWYNTSIRFYDYQTGAFTTSAITLGSAAHYSCGCVMNSGKVFVPPLQATNAAIYDPDTDSVTYVNLGVTSFFGKPTLLDDGRVFCVNQSGSARIYNPSTNTVSTPGGTFPNSVGTCLLPDGRVFCGNTSGATAAIYNPVTNTTTTTAAVLQSSRGCVTLMDGRVLVSPYSSGTSYKVYNPVTDTATTTSLTGGGNLHGGTVNAYGTVIIPNYSGDVNAFVPGATSNPVVPLKALLSRFVNN